MARKSSAVEVSDLEVSDAPKARKARKEESDTKPRGRKAAATPEKATKGSKAAKAAPAPEKASRKSKAEEKPAKGSKTATKSAKPAAKAAKTDGGGRGGSRAGWKVGAKMPGKTWSRLSLSAAQELVKAQGGKFPKELPTATDEKGERIYKFLDSKQRKNEVRAFMTGKGRLSFYQIRQLPEAKSFFKS